MAAPVTDTPRSCRDAAQNYCAATWSDNQGELDAAEAESLWPGRRPSGFVDPLEMSGDYDWDVGPDAF